MVVGGVRLSWFEAVNMMNIMFYDELVLVMGFLRVNLIQFASKQFPFSIYLGCIFMSDSISKCKKKTGFQYIYIHQVNFTKLMVFWDTNPGEFLKLPTKGSHFLAPKQILQPLHFVFTSFQPKFPHKIFIHILKLFPSKKKSRRKCLRLTCRLPKALEILDLSQNCFGDDGLEQFSRHLPPRLGVTCWTGYFFFTKKNRCFLIKKIVVFFHKKMWVLLFLGSMRCSCEYT